MKEKLKTIQIHNVEGNNEFITIEANQSIWNNAQQKINEWIIFCPQENEGYHKVDVVLFWENTEFYFRFDFNKSNTDLKKDFLDHINFYIKCPSHIKEKEWQGYIRSFSKINPDYFNKVTHIIKNCEL